MPRRLCSRPWSAMLLSILGQSVRPLCTTKVCWGSAADLSSPPALSRFTSTYRQDVIFNSMCQTVTRYLRLWYTA